MKKKIKIKTLILIVFIFIVTSIWIVPNTILVIAKFVKPEKAIYFYEKYAAYPTTSKIRGRYFIAKDLVNSKSKYTVYFNGWGGGTDTSRADVEYTITILEDIMKETPKNEAERNYYLDSYEMLLDMGISSGNVGLLKDWISFGQEADDEDLVYLGDIYQAFLFHVNDERDRAKDIVAKYDGGDQADGMLDILKAEIALFDGDYQVAEEQYKKIRDNNWAAIMGGNFTSDSYRNRNFWFEDKFERLKGDNIIRGSVTYEGEAMPFVEIYVLEGHGGISIGGDSYFAITDENGEFETLGLRDGVYNIGIGLDNSLLEDRVLQQKTNHVFELDGSDGEFNFVFKDTFQVDMAEYNEEKDELTVSWEEVEGAAYYTVVVASFSDGVGKDGAVFYSPAVNENGDYRISESSASFDMEVLRSDVSGHGLDEDNVKTSNAILNLFSPGIEYPIFVNAYDENDKLVTSSLPLRSYYDEIPSITMEGDLSEGEELIFNQDYIEAIEYYEDVLEEDGDNIDALRYLTKMYGLGWKLGEKNLERGLELGDRYSTITGSNRLFKIIVGDMTIDEIREYGDLYYSTLLENKDNFHDMYHYYLSRYYIAEENWEEARDALEDSDDIYLYDNLFYLNMYLGDYANALDNVNYLYRNLAMSLETREAIENLIDSPPQGKDKEGFNNFLLELVKGIDRKKGISLYKETIKEVINEDIKVVLRDIYYDRGWDIVE